MIYFVQSVDGGPIKIGHSVDVGRRVGQLEGAYKTPLAVLATMPGGRDEEQEIHARFSHLRLGRTEQFRPAPELLEFIGRPLLVNGNPDAVEVMPETSSIKLDRTIALKAKLVALHRRISVAELLTEIMRAPINEAYTAVIRELVPKE